MKSINNIGHLKEFGFEFLTGESDALMLRQLYDVTLRGKAILCQAFGIAEHGLILPSQWNSGASKCGSILLSPVMVEAIAPFCLLIGNGVDQPAHTVLMCRYNDGTSNTIGLYEGEAFKAGEYDYGTPVGEPPRLIKGPEFTTDNGCTWSSWPSSYGMPKQVIKNPGTPEKFRNVHQMSGRTV